jgi:hypothetical protein
MLERGYKSRKARPRQLCKPLEAAGICNTQLNRQNRVCYGIKLVPSDCGIDHQSAYHHDNIDEFLTDNNLEDLHEFIFGKAVLHTDSD